MTTCHFERFRGAAPARPKLVLLPLVAALTAGCQTMTMRPDDVGDICAAQRVELRNSQQYYQRAVAEGAAAGALIGGLAGLLAGDSGKAVALSAAAGAVVGGIGGYYMAKQRVAADAASLNAAVYQDVVGANQEIDKAALAFVKLRDCRYAAVWQVKQDYRTGRLTRAEAQARLADLRRLFEADLQVADEVGAKMSERAREYRYAADELGKQSVATASATTSKARAAPTGGNVASATQTNQIKQKAFVDEVQVAKSKAPTMFSLEGQVGMTSPVCPLPGAA